ncbi:hypothetical protein [Clostridium sp. BJN0001]|uniref:hypothetical protein n=1 Tax=Clostridium sp. BJN0001 TaxID=2930219 RepID=UPI001FCFF06C|nr:hypothetical protein [Clostridium sp. BJN0001]
MQIFIYQTYSDWYKDKATEVLEGEVSVLYNGLIAVDTIIDGKKYRQIFSTKNNFGVIYKFSDNLLTHKIKINIYHDIDSWESLKPEISFSGRVCEDEMTDNRFVFINEDGFKHYLSLDSIYSVTYDN